MSPITTSVATVTDSTCDIPHNTADLLRIRVVPTLLTLEGKTYEDGHRFSRSVFSHRMPCLTRPAMTAAVSSKAFESAYESALASGVHNAVSIHVSSRLSGIFDAATQAAESSGERVKPLDGGHIFMALGFQAILAAEAALEGAALDTMIRILDQARQRVRRIALIDTLEYLKRSGRVTWLRASIGDLLRVRLLVSIIDGLGRRIDKIRTKCRGLERLMTLARSWGRLERLAVLHSGVPDDARAFAEQLGNFTSHPLIVIEVTPVIGARVGPARLGLAARLGQV